MFAKSRAKIASFEQSGLERLPESTNTQDQNGINCENNSVPPVCSSPFTFKNNQSKLWLKVSEKLEQLLNLVRKQDKQMDKNFYQRAIFPKLSYGQTFSIYLKKEAA